MNNQPPVSLRLINDLDTVLNHHCSLCLFFHESRTPCDHKPRTFPRPTPSECSDSSFYTAQTSDTIRPASSHSLSRTIATKASSALFPRNRPLRRKISPRESSLRELRTKQSRQCLVRTKQSEEQLQRVYESQILAYLEGPSVELDCVLGTLDSHGLARSWRQDNMGLI